MGALDLIAKAAKGIKKAPFFSKADVVLDELQRGKGTGDEFLTELVKKGVKPTELKDRGLDKALKGKPKMTKAEVQKVFEEKAPPKVQEKVLTGEMPDYDEFLENTARDWYGVDYWDLFKYQREEIEKAYDKLPTTKYDEYRTPGGENYREILLKLPKRSLTDDERWELDLFNRDLQKGYEFSTERQARFDELKAKQAASIPDYTSSHFKEDPNLLAHIRVQDFKTPDGKKVLLVDEIQSDWHQQGRKKGYATGKEEQDYVDYLKDLELKAKNEAKQDFISEGVAEERAEVLADRMAKRLAEDPRHLADYFGGDVRAKQMELHQARMDARNAIPDAPFKKNWHELAMKRVLDYAAENGYDTVAITPGAEQAKRYDLSKQIDSVVVSPFRAERGEYTLQAIGKDGKTVIDKNDVQLKDLDDYIGKDLADKARQQMVDFGKSNLTGVDLTVGGEGMKGFYDKILPDYLNNYGKQYGAQTGQISLRTPSGEPWNIEDAARFHGMSGADYLDNPNRSQLEKQFLESRDNQTTGFHSFDITPQMREQIQTKGQPLYSKIGVPGAEAAAGAGAATMGSQMFDENNEQSVQNPVHFTENPDAMLLELMQRN